MSDEEVLEFYKKLQEHYGERLANFEHYPRQFAHQVLLYKYYNKDQNENRNL